ncbi:MAG: hypothetical protein RTU63_00830 [Candidatus Thorarchaeota archaeon]
MTRIDKKTLLGLLVVAAMTFSLLVTPASAATVTMTDETFERGFVSDENGHTYLYVEPTPFDLITSDYVEPDEDMDWARYRNGNNGWDRATGTFSTPGMNDVFWHSHDGMTTDGVWGEQTILPTFWDIDGELNSTTNRRSFSLNMGQTTTIAMESEMGYTGTLPIGGAEFVYLTVNSLQDDCEWELLILDSNDVLITYYGGMDGDISIIPFKPGEGTHYIWIGASFDHTGLLMFDLHPQAVTPETIPAGSVVQGTLEGSETVIEDGSIIHKERVPDIRTYKYTSPNDLAKVSYSFNYPDMMPSNPIILTLTSDAYMWGEGAMRMYYDFGFPLSDSFYYKSIQGETYYLTVQGGDNTEYAIYNSIVENAMPPLNEEFLVQNLNSDPSHVGYHLVLEEDSFMKVNATEYHGTSDWFAYSVTDDMFMRQFTLGYDTYFPDSPIIYLPAGEYVIQGTLGDNYLAEMEFNIGPITEDLSTSIESFRIGGFKVPTNAIDFYNMSIELLTEDNVTATTQLEFFDRTGRTLLDTSYPLSNWWDGSELMEHPTWSNLYTLPITTTTTDEYTLIAVSPMYVANNTEGSLTDVYGQYNVSYALAWDEVTDEFFKEMHTLNVGDGASYVFDLAIDDADAWEYYYLELNLTMGVWYNVSVITEDVDDFDFTLLHNIGGRIHHTPWEDLDDNEVGAIDTELVFEFGSLTENPVFFLDVFRTLSDDGNLTIHIEPFVTNTLGDLPDLVPTSDVFAGLIAATPYIAVGGIIVVVVVVVYIKKFKK